MKVSRDFQRPFRYFFDQVLPPILRDSFLFRIALMVIFRKDARTVFEFRGAFPQMTDEQVREIYQRLAKRALKVETDLNQACLERIRQQTKNLNVLDVGCGTGALSQLLSLKSYKGIDFVSHPTWRQLTSDSSSFIEGFVEKLPFGNDEFDVVICAHVLEHVRHPHLVLAELIRCSKSAVIVVLPRERSYRAGFNLHVHQFQYVWEVERLLSAAATPVEVVELDGDFFALINVNNDQSDIN